MAHAGTPPPIELDLVSRRQSLQSRMLSAFHWEEGDAKPAIRGALLLFLIVAAFVILKTLRDAQFLSIYPARLLPRYMAINTVVSAAVAFLLLRLYSFVSLPRLLQGALLLFAIGPLLIWESLPGHFHIKPTHLYVLVGIYGTIIPVLGWALVSTQLSSRQAKRTLGFIGSGAILGGIAGGLLARSIVNEWGLQGLLPCASFLILAAVVLTPFVSGQATDNTPPPVVAPLERKKMRWRYALLLLAIVATGTIVSTFLDFQFKAYTQREYDSEIVLGSFIGTFYAVLGVATFLFQLLVTPFLLRRLGIAAGMAAMPFLLLLGSTALYFRKSFSAIVTLRGSEEMMRHSLDRSSFEMLLMAIPVHQKIRLKSLVETVGNRTFELVASLILMGLYNNDESTLTMLTVANMGLTFVWFVSALWIGLHEYPKLLREVLRREEFDIETVRQNLFSNDFYRILPPLLRNAGKETALSLLELIQDSKKDWLARYLTSLDHNDAEVRLRTLQVLFLQKADMQHRVKRLLNDPDERVRAEAVHYLCTRARSPKQYIDKFKKDEPLAVRVALASSGMKAGSKESHTELEALLKLAEKEADILALQEIAHLLQFVTPNDFSVRLYKRLLSNANIEVRKAALTSIGYTKPQILIPILLRLTRVPALKEEVHATLVKYGKTLSPYLEEIILNSGESLPRRKLALKIASDLSGIQMLDAVLKAAQDPNISLRFSAMKTLNYFRKNGTLTADHPVALPIVQREIEVLDLELQRAFLFAPQDGTLIGNLLRQRVTWTYERVFRCLGLIHPPDAVYHAYRGWISGDSRKHDAAIEFLEHTLTPEIRDRLLPLLELKPPDAPTEEDEKKAQRQEGFQLILKENDPLLISAALVELSEEEFAYWLPKIQKSLSEQPLIEETLNRRTSPMAKDENQPLTMIEKMENLSKIDVFSKLSSSDLLLLGEIVREVNFEAGDVIYREGDPSLEIFSVITGRIEEFRSSELIGSAGPGESFGTLGVLSNQNRTTTSVAAEQSCCLAIEGDTFWEIVEDYTPVCHGVIEVLVQRIETLNARVAGESNELQLKPAKA